MLRVERTSGALTLVSRLARPHVLAVLAGVLLAAAGAAAARLPIVAGALAAVALLVVVFGGRAVRVRFAGGRVEVRAAVPFARERRSLAEFSCARVETIADARRRKADLRARVFRERSGVEIPPWLRPPDSPGMNDHLRRVVLVARRGEPLAVTAWLADGDLEAVRADVEALVMHGGLRPADPDEVR